MAFAESVSKRWEDSPDEFNEVFYKHLVAKAILYGALRRAVSKADWYESGYLANIVAYALAKLSYEVGTQAPGYRFDFDAIWQAQGVDDGVTRVLVDLGRLCASVLTDPRRPIANVTEWAKREACWEAVRAARWELPIPIATALASTTVVREKKKVARSNQRIDSGIDAQARVLAIGADGWKSVSSFAGSRNVSTEMERGVLAVAASGRLPSEKQAAVLLRLLERVSELGFKELG